MLLHCVWQLRHNMQINDPYAIEGIVMFTYWGLNRSFIRTESEVGLFFWKATKIRSPANLAADLSGSTFHYISILDSVLG